MYEEMAFVVCVETTAGMVCEENDSGAAAASEGCGCCWTQWLENKGGWKFKLHDNWSRSCTTEVLILTLVSKMSIDAVSFCYYLVPAPLLVNVIPIILAHLSFQYNFLLNQTHRQLDVIQLTACAALIQNRSMGG